MRKTSKRTVRIASLLATGICLLALLAGCGQTSTGTQLKSAPSDQSQKTGQTPQNQASFDKAETSSGGASMSGGKSEAPNAQTQTGSPSVPSSSQTSQTKPSAPSLQASNEAIRVMAYVKAMGGVANVPAKNLIVNSNLLALETVSGNDGNMKLVTVSGDQVMVTDEVFGPPSSTADKTTVYNVSDLLGEYYQTQEQQDTINNLLDQGTRHNLIDFLAYMQVWGKGDFTGQNVEIMGNVVSGGTADTTGTITLNGNEVTVTNAQPNCGGSQGCQPSTSHTWTFNADELLSKYYSTASQKQAVNNYINRANQTQSQWLPSAGQIQN